MSIEVRVPATLSNLGSGFDVLGMAIDIENVFQFDLIEPKSFTFGGERITPQSHLATRTMLEAAQRFGPDLPGGIAITQSENVPRSRGLGSSATARVAGLAAWLHFTEAEVATPQLMALLSDLEGHPDNIVPAMVGGLTICAHAETGLQHLRLAPPNFQIALCIPRKTVSTNAARNALPARYKLDDAVFNLSRIAFLVVGLMRGDDDAVGLGGEDRLHQSYRGPLIGPVSQAFSAARKEGAATAFISGSGSTLAALVPPGADAAAVAKAMASALDQEAPPETRVVAVRDSGFSVSPV